MDDIFDKLEALGVHPAELAHHWTPHSYICIHCKAKMEDVTREQAFSPCPERLDKVRAMLQERLDEKRPSG